MATDNPLVSYGWCKPSEVFLNILNGVPGPGDVRDCEVHTWTRAYESMCECFACATHRSPSHLECEVCYEWWSPGNPDREGWQEVWDSLE